MTASAGTASGDGTRPRLLALDALRCLAVLLVLGRHLERPTAGVPAPLGAVLAVWQRIGWIGVDLFFVLSGFLVGGLLFAELRRHGDVQVGRFLLRRGCKIYPGFYALLLVSLLWLGARLPGAAFAWEALFVQNYASPTVWNHTWSLAVEEHFYLLLAGAVYLATRGRPGPAALTGLPLVVAGLAVTVLGMRIATWLHAPAEHLLFPTHLRLDGLALGTALAYGWHLHGERTRAFVARWRPWLAVLWLLPLLPSLLLPLEHSAVVNTVGLTGNALGFGVLLLLVLTRPELERARPVRAMARLGFYSYSLYLWHMPVQKAVRWFVEPVVGHGAGMLVYLLGSLLAGVVMAKLVELPVLALRERWLRSRPLAVPPVVVEGAAVAPVAVPPPVGVDLDAVPPALVATEPPQPTARR